MTVHQQPFAAHLIGHEDAVAQVTEALASSRMHHAWLITGIEGIGKTTLATHIAANVLSGGENLIGRINSEHRVTKLIAADAHPDMLVIKRSVDEKTGEPRKVIVVDDVLKVASFLHKTSTHGGWRVVVIDEAQLLNRFGQNAVLKILEEPPARTLILITVTTPGALLPTIRSRCRTLPLAPLTDQQLKTILLRHSPETPAPELDRAIEVSSGSAGFALKVLSTEILPLFEEVEGMFAKFPALDIARIHKIADKISPKAETESFDVLTTLLVDSLARAARHDAKSGLPPSQLDCRLQLWDKVRNSFAATDDANLDRKLAFINAINDIRAAAN